MKSFELNFATVLIRFYLMMGVIILGFFIGQPWLAVLGLPIFLSALLGTTFGRTAKTEAKVTRLSKSAEMEMGKVG